MAAPELVSSGDSGEEERPDSEATLEGEGETSPLVADLLHALPDDDEAGDHPVREPQAPAGVTTRSSPPDEAVGRGPNEEQVDAGLLRWCPCSDIIRCCRRAGRHNLVRSWYSRASGPGYKASGLHAFEEDEGLHCHGPVSPLP